MAKKKIRVGNAILCEYVTKGSRNKHILVNAYSGNVIFEALPNDFGFGLYIEILEDQPGDPIAEITMSLRFDGVEFASMAAQTPVAGKFGTLMVPMIQTRVEGNTTFDVVLSSTGYADTVALSKRLYAAPLPSEATLPNVSPPPSSRSRRASPAS